MSQIETIYLESIRKTTNFLKAARLSGDANDYVNDAWLQLSTGGNEITVGALCVAAKKSAYASQEWKEFATKESTRVCPKCHQDLPVAYFGTFFSKYRKRLESRSYCKDCHETYQKGQIANITDGYIRHNLKKLGHAGAITQEMIDKMRGSILIKRSRRALRTLN